MSSSFDYVPDPDGVPEARPAPAPRGRGATANPGDRFQRIEVVPDPQADAPDRPRTILYRDRGRSIISENNSPDVGFTQSLNPYRGCEHGCAYCYARPTHEYLGWSAGLDFETRLVVKQNAAELLRQTLASPRYRPRTLVLSGVTDAYQPVERRLGITRACLEVLSAARHPVSVITKNHLVARDADLLAGLASHGAASVFVSVTTLDDDLRRRLEPRTSSPRRRLATIRALARAGVPTGVMVGPVIPGLTEHELPAILRAAAEAGATQAGYIVMRLPHGVADLFAAWLEEHYPARKNKVLNRVRALRGGKLNDPRFGSRMRGEGVFAREIRGLFELGLRGTPLTRRSHELSAAAFLRPAPGGQGDLFQDG